MNAKPFTLSVVVAAVVGAVSLVSAQIDKQVIAAESRPVPVASVARDPAAPLATASPLDIDPRRMEAPVVESETPMASTQGEGSTVAVSSAD